MKHIYMLGFKQMEESLVQNTKTGCLPTDDVWNHLVDEKWQYRTIIDNDVPKVYREKELIHLIVDTGFIRTISYKLILKTSDHIEIGAEGVAEV